MLKRILLVLLLALAGSPAWAQGSTINPNIPASGSPLSSAVIRNQFAAAIADINGLMSQFMGATAPANPLQFQSWCDTHVQPFNCSYWDGSTWVTYGMLDPVAHTFTPSGGLGTPLLAANNLSDIVSVASARSNLGLGPFATQTSPCTSSQGCAGTVTGALKADGAGNVAAAAAADLSNGTTGSGAVVLATSPTLSSPVVGTQTALDNSTKAASTAYVTGAIATAITASGQILYNYLGGCGLSNDGTNPNTTLDIAACQATDSTNASFIVGPAITKLMKTQGGTSCTSAFVAGNGNCGMTSTINVDTGYTVFAGMCSGSYDVWFDADPAGSHKPGCFTSYRHIGTIRISNLVTNIPSFFTIGDRTYLTTPEEICSCAATTSRSTQGFGIQGVMAILRVYDTDSAAANNTVVQPTYETDAAPSVNASPGITLRATASGVGTAQELEILTDASGNIAYRSSTTTATLNIVLRGWLDTKGRP